MSSAGADRSPNGRPDFSATPAPTSTSCSWSASPYNENLERWLLASTDRAAIDAGVGAFVRVFGARDAGLIAWVAAELAWLHLGPTWTYSTELGGQISIDAGLRFGLF